MFGFGVVTVRTACGNFSNAKRMPDYENTLTNQESSASATNRGFVAMFAVVAQQLGVGRFSHLTR